MVIEAVKTLWYYAYRIYEDCSILYSTSYMIWFALLAFMRIFFLSPKNPFKRRTSSCKDVLLWSSIYVRQWSWQVFSLPSLPSWVSVWTLFEVRIYQSFWKLDQPFSYNCCCCCGHSYYDDTSKNAFRINIYFSKPQRYWYTFFSKESNWETVQNGWPTLNDWLCCLMVSFSLLLQSKPPTTAALIPPMINVTNVDMV